MNLIGMKFPLDFVSQRIYLISFYIQVMQRDEDNIKDDINILYENGQDQFLGTCTVYDNWLWMDTWSK